MSFPESCFLTDFAYMTGGEKTNLALGHRLREHFFFPEGYRNLNHGSFGTYPRSVRAKLRQVQDAAEERPDQFIRYDYKKELLASRQALAELLHVSVDTCVMVSNATTGVNVVLRNLVYQPGDIIVYFDTIYGACEKTIASVIESFPQVGARKITYTLPCRHDHIVKLFTETIENIQKEGFNPKIAVFDTISSMPAVRLPFEQLVTECKRLQILSCIDGAHGVGQIPLNLGELDPDFFVSNCHKWLFVPRGCAVFVVPERNQHLIRTTLPTSHGFTPVPNPGMATIMNPFAAGDSNPFVNLFQYVATIDSSPYYCIPEALLFRNEICGGEAAIYDYILQLAKEGGHKMAKAWSTDLLLDDEGRLGECAMFTVRLPLEPGSDLPEEDVAQARAWMETTIMYQHNSFIQIHLYNNKLWARMSALVYLEVGDFDWAAELILDLCKQVKGGKYRSVVS